MTTSSITAAGACAPYAAPPAGRRRSASFWLAVALVSTGGLIAVSVLRVVDAAEDYLAVSTRVEAGSLIDRSDLTTVRITADPALRPIRASAADDVIGRFASVTLVPGTLLTQAQLADVGVPGPGVALTTGG
ncbi:SAF domain-containing protein [Micromonospora sp. DT48]|uniref:SAF domain-containing protein n=1 Tax=Micromonospora sp. DT48 TaxID=3393429 RepID=UPI003CF45506